MANNLTTQQQTVLNLPVPSAKARERIAAGQSSAKNFLSNMPMPFARLSLKGKQFTLHNGSSEPYVFFDRGAPQPIDVVLIAVAPTNAKAWYKHAYDGVSMDQPDCWSNDGVTPDASIPDTQKQNPTCRDCRWNRPGTSRNASADGKGSRSKACADSRKVVVAWPEDLPGGELGPVSLRLPYMSHAPLYQYVKQLVAAGFDPNTVVTKIYFDPAEAYPKLVFQFERVLTDDEIDIARAWEVDERTQRILNAAPEGEQPSDMNPVHSRQDTGLSMPAAAPKAEPTPAPTPAPEPTPEPEAAPQAAAEPEPAVDSGDEPAPLTGEVLPPETPAIDPSWVAIPAMPGIYFSPALKGMVHADGTPYSVSSAPKAEAAAPAPKPAFIPGTKRERGPTPGPAPVQAQAAAPASSNGARAPTPKKLDDFMKGLIARQKPQQ